jgi:hypothetical protein
MGAVFLLSEKATQKNFREAGCTLKTANSTGSGLIFVQISGFKANPIKYTDPDGREIEWEQGAGVSDAELAEAKAMAENIRKSDTEAGRRWQAANDSDKTVTIYVNHGKNPDGKKVGNSAVPGSDHIMGLGDMLKSALGIGGDAWINFNLNDVGLGDGSQESAESTLAHEMGHAYLMMEGRNPWTRKARELDGTAIDNQYRDSLGIGQRKIYGMNDPKMGWNVPQYNNGSFHIYDTNKKYHLRKVK